ncbi:helix-turn-helix domain-containing protein [Actinocorallia lasiicapitis]
METSRRPIGHVDWVQGREHWDHWWRYLTPSPAHRRLGLVCLAVGDQNGRLPTVGPRVLDHPVAVIVLSGAGWFSADGAEPVDVVAPAVIWLIPGVPHHYGPYEPGWSECFVDFAGPAVEAYAELGLLDPAVPVTPLTSAEPARLVVRKIAAAVRRGGPHVDVEAAAGVHELLATLLRSRAEDAEGDRVLAALARDAHEPWPVAEHARRLGLTLAELREAVRKGAGASPKDYLLTIRLNLAKELLTTTDLPVAAIARRTGYEDPAYFTRIFTRRAGISPSGFREQHFH